MRRVVLSATLSGQRPTTEDRVGCGYSLGLRHSLCMMREYKSKFFRDFPNRCWLLFQQKVPEVDGREREEDLSDSLFGQRKTRSRTRVIKSAGSSSSEG